MLLELRTVETQLRKEAAVLVVVHIPHMQEFVLVGETVHHLELDHLMLSSHHLQNHMPAQHILASSSSCHLARVVLLVGFALHQILVAAVGHIGLADIALVLEIDLEGRTY